MGNVIFSERLKSLMKEKGITQQQLANAAEVNQASVHGWLAGSFPRADALQRVAQFFGVSMESLLGAGETLPPMMSMAQSMGASPVAIRRWIKALRALADDMERELGGSSS